MRDILSLAKVHVLTALRERVTLFWFLVFPLFLLTILTLIFGQVGEEQEIHFAITLIVHEQLESNLPFSASAIILDAFDALATPQGSDNVPLFSIHTSEVEDDFGEFLDRELTELRRGNRAAILVIPAGFDQSVSQQFLSPDEGTSSVAEVQLYMSQTSVASETASSIIEQVFAELDRGILSQMGQFDETQAVIHVTDWLGEEESETKYVDFILPGILLMGFFTNGLFGVPGTILFNRDRKVLRRYWVTPLSVARYLVGFGLGHLFLCVLQFVLIVLLGKLAFGATVSFAAVSSILILILAAITFMVFGFMIAAIARSANAGMAVANILNMPMMFLSGMFFPLAGLPLFMKVIVFANPVTYLLESLRQSVGVQASTLMPWPWTFVVPLLWIGVCGVITIRRLRWDVAR